MEDAHRELAPIPDLSLAAKLAKKMVAAMKATSSIPKRGHNKHFGYHFARGDDVLEAVRQALVENGIAFSVQIIELAQTPSGTQTSRGAPIIHSVATLMATYIDMDTGFAQVQQWMGECLEAEDKGINKAATSAIKYALLKQFLIPTGDEADDPDAAASAAGEEKKATRKKAAAKEKPEADPLRKEAKAYLAGLELGDDALATFKATHKGMGKSWVEYALLLKEAGVDSAKKFAAAVKDDLAALEEEKQRQGEQE